MLHKKSVGVPNILRKKEKLGQASKLAEKNKPQNNSNNEDNIEIYVFDQCEYNELPVEALLNSDLEIECGDVVREIIVDKSQVQYLNSPSTSNNENNVVNLTKKCRLCLNEVDTESHKTENHIRLFDKIRIREGEELRNKIYYIFDRLHFEPWEDPLVCNKCVRLIRITFPFIRRVWEVEKFFNKQKDFKSLNLEIPEFLDNIVTEEKSTQTTKDVEECNEPTCEPIDLVELSSDSDDEIVENRHLLKKVSKEIGNDKTNDNGKEIELMKYLERKRELLTTKLLDLVSTPVKVRPNALENSVKPLINMEKNVQADSSKEKSAQATKNVEKHKQTACEPIVSVELNSDSEDEIIVKKRLLLREFGKEADKVENYYKSKETELSKYLERRKESGTTMLLDFVSTPVEVRPTVLNGSVLMKPLVNTEKNVQTDSSKEKSAQTTKNVEKDKQIACEPADSVELNSDSEDEIIVKRRLLLRKFGKEADKVENYHKSKETKLSKYLERNKESGTTMLLDFVSTPLEARPKVLNGSVMMKPLVNTEKNVQSDSFKEKSAQATKNVEKDKQIACEPADSVELNSDSEDDIIVRRRLLLRKFGKEADKVENYYKSKETELSKNLERRKESGTTMLLDFVSTPVEARPKVLNGSVMMNPLVNTEKNVQSDSFKEKSAQTTKNVEKDKQIACEPADSVELNSDSEDDIMLRRRLLLRKFGKDADKVENYYKSKEMELLKYLERRKESETMLLDFVSTPVEARPKVLNGSVLMKPLVNTERNVQSDSFKEKSAQTTKNVEKDKQIECEPADSVELKSDSEDDIIRRHLLLRQFGNEVDKVENYYKSKETELSKYLERRKESGTTMLLDFVSTPIEVRPNALQKSVTMKPLVNTEKNVQSDISNENSTKRFENNTKEVDCAAVKTARLINDKIYKKSGSNSLEDFLLKRRERMKKFLETNDYTNTRKSVTSTSNVVQKDTNVKGSIILPANDIQQLLSFVTNTNAKPVTISGIDGKQTVLTPLTFLNSKTMPKLVGIPFRKVQNATKGVQLPTTSNTNDVESVLMPVTFQKTGTNATDGPRGVLTPITFRTGNTKAMLIPITSLNVSKNGANITKPPVAPPNRAENFVQRTPAYDYLFNKPIRNKEKRHLPKTFDLFDEHHDSYFKTFNGRTGCYIIRKYKNFATRVRKNDSLLCHICGYCAGKKSTYLNHMLRHKGDHFRVCYICGQKLTGSTTKSHMQLKHSLPNFKCSECGKKFHFKGTLTKHIEHIHTNVNPVQCQICGKMFKSSSMKSHLWTHKMSTKTMETYKCDICQKEFRKSRSLKLHRRRHFLAYDYSCPYCGRFMKYEKILNHHIRTFHEGNPDFKCSICGRPFARKEVWLRHVQMRHRPIKERIKKDGGRRKRRSKNGVEKSQDIVLDPQTEVVQYVLEEQEETIEYETEEQCIENTQETEVVPDVSMEISQYESNIEEQEEAIENLIMKNLNRDAN